MVIATYNRLHLLQKALDAVCAQREVSYEVVVVDDCSTDGTAAYLEEVAALGPMPIRFIVADRNGGPAVARNLAWPTTHAPYVAFTDDDCEPEPGWLRALLDGAVETDADLVQGRTIPNPDHEVTSCWNRAVRAEALSHRYQTCNLLVRKRVLAELGGFDESYAFAGEDADLGWRALALGCGAVYCADALVFHALRPLDLRGYLRLRRGWAQLVQFHKRHPESRSLLLYRGVFFRREHLAVTGGLVVAPISVYLGWWWLVPALYVVQSVRLARRHRFHGRTALRLKYAIAQPFAEVWEILHFAVQSVRHRTLIL